MSWMKTEPSCESLNKYWSPKYDETKIKEGQRVTRPDVGVLWVGHRSTIKIENLYMPKKNGFTRYLG